ncbi:hypothetical protein MLD38_028476 [Melastoma candidum]|uniref:Uncharacterized protein n=1 Tax=Melastoma candidum TaxID=119954 RepID=A0ACB9N183_9MYRT|nr:hypothetical protein MLD38_028476 [Melastoma candidum]
MAAFRDEIVGDSRVGYGYVRHVEGSDGVQSEGFPYAGLYVVEVRDFGFFDEPVLTDDLVQIFYRPSEKFQALDVGKSSNILLRDLRFKNSPQMHIVIKHSKYVFVTNVTVHTPGYIPNTDGIHIQNSEHVYVSDYDIRTGDDYISISDGTSDIYVEGIHCGPGHGIRQGWLRRSYRKHSHPNVHFRGTNNGVRINTWQGGRGYVKNIIFEDIICHRVLNPIYHRPILLRPRAIEDSTICIGCGDGKQ